jgi:hypothetical protein
MKLLTQVRAAYSRDGAVLLDVHDGQMYRLNVVGSRMLELLNAGSTEIQIADELSLEFGVARETVAKDLQEFFARLQEHSLLEPGTSEAQTKS